MFDIFKPKDENKIRSNVYLVDCGLVNYNPNTDEYKVGMTRYKNCGYSLTNTENYAYTDLYKAIEKAKEFTSINHRTYAVVSVYEYDLDEYELYSMLRHSDKEIADELAKDVSVKRVCFSIHRYMYYMYYDIIEKGGLLINKRETNGTRYRKPKKVGKR